jgi:flagellar assembly protein FliH
MSLSRVIKSGSFGERPVAAYSFDNFQGRPVQGFHGGADGFMPFFANNVSPPAADEIKEDFADSSFAEGVDEVSGMLMISEEELDLRIQEAYARGIEEERKQADEDLAGICSALTAAVSIVSKLRERIVKESEEELLKLSFMVAKKIIRQEIKQDRQIMTLLVSEALREFPEQHDIVLCLHPEDYKVISSNKELFLSGVGDERQITLKSDEAMTLGGCVVESSAGIIDARIEAQLDEIYRNLIEERSILFDISDADIPKSPQDKD